MNPLFANLTPLILENIEDQLANNDVSSDEEMFDFLLEELGLSAEQAEAAIALRPQYQVTLFLTGQGPLHLACTVEFSPASKTLAPNGELTFDQVLDLYRLLLESRPGKLLKLAFDGAAGIEDGRLFGTYVDTSRPGTTFEVYDFDRNAFQDGHWLGETPEQTRAAIENPVFIDR